MPTSPACQLLVFMPYPTFGIVYQGRVMQSLGHLPPHKYKTMPRKKAGQFIVLISKTHHDHPDFTIIPFCLLINCNISESGTQIGISFRKFFFIGNWDHIRTCYEKLYLYVIYIYASYLPQMMSIFSGFNPNRPNSIKML